MSAYQYQPTDKAKLTVKGVEEMQRKEDHPEKAVSERDPVGGVDEEDMRPHDHIGKEVESDDAQ